MITLENALNGTGGVLSPWAEFFTSIGVVGTVIVIGLVGIMFSFWLAQWHERIRLYFDYGADSQRIRIAKYDKEPQRKRKQKRKK